MIHSNDIPYEARRRRLLAFASEPQHFTSTAVNLVPMPGRRPRVRGPLDLCFSRLDTRPILPKATPVAGSRSNMRT